MPRAKRKLESPIEDYSTLCITFELFPDENDALLLLETIKQSNAALEWLHLKSAEIGAPNKMKLNAFYEDVRGMFALSSSQTNVYTTLALMYRRKKNRAIFDQYDGIPILFLDRKGFSHKSITTVEITTLTFAKRVLVPAFIIEYKRSLPLSRSMNYYVLYQRGGQWFADAYVPSAACLAQMDGYKVQLP